tara:strand:- start:1175 stop:1879 length:705 start_codon:yes stop_codon:yes gene_type:complete
MQQYLQNKKGLVDNVFNKVYQKYDLMNDLMSFGLHRIWKKNLINMMNPGKNKILADVACGTADLAKQFLDNSDKNNKVYCIDPNKEMLKKGKDKLIKYENINWLIGSAESLPLKDNSCDYYIISFGLRNTKDLNKSISEAYRVLKTGGRYFCLEFSKIQNVGLEFIYKKYTKIIPDIGNYVVGEKHPYEYLIKSIEDFINQEELLELIKFQKFENCTYRNLSGGVVAIHSGWKI